MAVRSIAQVVAGVVAGAVLVGVPTWALASEPDDSPSSSSDVMGMMSSPASPHESIGSMSKMMDDPEMRSRMRSMMSDSMDQMSGMLAGGMSGHGKPGMAHMQDMGRGSMPGRSTEQ